MVASYISTEFRFQGSRRIHVSYIEIIRKNRNRGTIKTDNIVGKTIKYKPNQKDASTKCINSNLECSLLLFSNFFRFFMPLFFFPFYSIDTFPQRPPFHLFLKHTLKCYFRSLYEIRVTCISTMSWINKTY